MSNDSSVEGGFTSFPAHFFARLPHDLSHGAKLTLAILCEHAHSTTGACSVSYRLLAERLGRSKASISNYVKELTSRGYVQTHQKTRYGYKSCLEFVVPFYAKFRAELKANKTRLQEPKQASRGRAATASKRIQPAEHCVQPVEHSRTNQKDSNHTTSEPTAEKPDGVTATVVSGIIREWRKLERGAQWPAFAAPVPPALLERTRRQVRSIPTDPPSICTAEGVLVEVCDVLRAAWQQAGAEASAEVLEQQACMVVARRRSDPMSAANQVCDLIRETWKPYWKRASTPVQFGKMLEACPDPDAERKCLEGYLRRAQLPENAVPAL